MKVLGTLCIMALAMAIAITPASAQLNSNVGTVTLSATLPESLTVSVTAGNAVSFTLASNTAANAGSTTSTIKTAWVLGTGRTSVTTWAWVANNANVLSDGAGDNIPASAISASAAGGGSAGGALNTSSSGGGGVPSFIAPAAASGVQIGNTAIAVGNRASSSTITLTWNINTTGALAQFPAGTYNNGGVVNIQAQATP